MMNKILSFLKRQWVQMVPLVATVLIIAVAYMVSVLSVGSNYCDYSCRVDFWEPLFFFGLAFLIGSLSLSFVNVKVLYSWAIFAFFYFLIVGFLISHQLSEAMFESGERVMYSIELGLALSVITILWAVIHSWILRKEKGETK